MSFASPQENDKRKKRRKSFIALTQEVFVQLPTVLSADLSSPKDVVRRRLLRLLEQRFGSCRPHALPADESREAGTRLKTLAVATDNSSTMTSSEDEVASIGYLKFGFNHEEGRIVYREWAPAAQEAQLIGDFNGLDCSNHKWEFRYPCPPKPNAPRIYEAHVGMISSEPRINSYREFADDVLPQIRANNYNTVQLMAVMEHSYYASFGYHVNNFFVVSSRSGTPEDLLKYLIDKAHSLVLSVLMDVVLSHASNNVTDGLNGYDVGQSSQDSYFHTGESGYHKLWDSRVFNYANWEVLRFLLSNLRWWLEEFNFNVVTTTRLT